MSEITITATEIVETNFGEKVLLDSPYEAKQYIKFMPWSADDGVNYDELEDDTPTPDYEFSPDFASHSSWDPEAYSWAIDKGTFGQAVDFFESVGIEVEDNTGLLP
jgi:hypothetical protein